MNILQLVPNKGWGGGEKCVLELSTALRNKGENIVVMIPKCDILRDKFKGFNKIELNIAFAYSLLSVISIKRIIKRNNINVIHTHIFKHAMACVIAKKLFGLNVKVIMTRHLCRKSKSHYTWLYKYIDKLIFVSNLAKDIFLSGSPRIDPQKIEVIHNSIDTSATSSLDTSIIDNISSDREVIRIGFAGRIVPEKGVLQMLDSIIDCVPNTNNNFVVLIAGTGNKEYVEMLKIKINNSVLKDKVSFIGFITDVIGFYKSVDIAIIPSMVNEACSLSVLEAMYSSCAIISSDGSQGEMLNNNKEAILINKGDIKGFSQAISSLINDKKQRECLSVAAHKRYINEFVFDKYIDRYLNIYKNLM